METIYAIDFDNTITKLNKKRIDTFISGDSEALLKNVRTVTKYLPDNFVVISSYSSEKERELKEKKIRVLSFKNLKKKIKNQNVFIPMINIL